MADGQTALSDDQTKVLWALSASGASLGQPATPAMVAEGIARSYGGSVGDPEIIEAQLQSMVEIGVVERHVLDTGSGFSMTPKGWGALGI